MRTLAALGSFHDGILVATILSAFDIKTSVCTIYLYQNFSLKIFSSYYFFSFPQAVQPLTSALREGSPIVALLGFTFSTLKLLALGGTNDFFFSFEFLSPTNFSPQKGNAYLQTRQNILHDQVWVFKLCQIKDAHINYSYPFCICLSSTSQLLWPMA